MKTAFTSLLVCVGFGIASGTAEARSLDLVYTFNLEVTDVAFHLDHYWIDALLFGWLSDEERTPKFDGVAPGDTFQGRLEFGGVGNYPGGGMSTAVCDLGSPYDARAPKYCGGLFDHGVFDLDETTGAISGYFSDTSNVMHYDLIPGVGGKIVFDAEWDYALNYSRITYAVTDITVSGLPSVPLPAGAVLYVTALTALSGAGLCFVRRSPRRNFQTSMTGGEI